MNALNDDCQLLVIKHLCLKDQFALFEATKEEPTSRWNANLRYNWEHQHSFSLDAGVFAYFAKKLKVVGDFLSSISPTVQQLNLKSITLDNLICLKSYTFPMMRSLEYKYDDWHSYSFYNSSIMRSMKYTDLKVDRVTKLFAELFPRLESLKPHGAFEYILLKNWMNLRKLDLSECWNRETFEMYEFEEIGELKTLEELTIADVTYFEEDIHKVFLRLPKLRSLTFSGTGWFGHIIKMLNKNIEEIIFCNSFDERIYNGFTNLRKLTIICELQYNGDLHEVFKTLPRLEHLDIVDSPIVESEIELWEVVACCPSLKILNIAGTDLGDYFFNISRRPMKKALDKRTTPLTLLCHGTQYYDEISLYFKHPNLKVSFEYLEKYFIDWMAVDEQIFCTIKFSALANEQEDC
ncbi:hypothetical protein ACLKA6_018120 [Drosophila palustris]